MARMSCKPFACLWNRPGRRGNKKRILMSNLIRQPSLVASIWDSGETKDSDTFMSFGEKISRAFSDPKQTTLTLRDFVSKSEPREVLMLNGTIKLSLPREWARVTFVDTVRGENYRRWVFKKIGILKKVAKAAKNLDIPLVFETKVNISNMSWTAVVSLLLEIRKDPDVTALAISGTFPCEGAENIVQALVGLVACDERSWISLHFHVIVRESENSLEYPESQRRLAKCKQALERLSYERDFLIGVRII
jgi:hypothetical protein